MRAGVERLSLAGLQLASSAEAAQPALMWRGISHVHAFCLSPPYDRAVPRRPAGGGPAYGAAFESGGRERRDPALARPASTKTNTQR